MPVELSWVAPEECPSRSEVLARVRELVGSAGDGAPVVAAEGEIRKVGGAFELRLLTEQEGQRGERLVRSAKCADLRGVAAVTLTLLLTSGQPSEPPPSEPSTAPEPAPPSAPTPPTPTAPPDAPAPTQASQKRSWRLLLAAPQLALQFGPLPTPAAKLSVGVGVEGAWWSVRVLGQWGDAQRIAALAEGYGARARRDSVGLWACTEHRLSALRVAPCLQGSAAWLRVEGYGPAIRAEEQTKLSWSVGVGVVGRAPLTSWLALMLGVAGQIELNRPELWINPSTSRQLEGVSVGQVRRLAPVSVTVLVGPEWIF